MVDIFFLAQQLWNGYEPVELVKTAAELGITRTEEDFEELYEYLESHYDVESEDLFDHILIEVAALLAPADNNFLCNQLINAESHDVSCVLLQEGLILAPSILRGFRSDAKRAPWYKVRTEFNLFLELCQADARRVNAIRRLIRHGEDVFAYLNDVYTVKPTPEAVNCIVAEHFPVVAAMLLVGKYFRGD